LRTAAFLILGATPGVALGYLLLLAYILNRVRPVPITLLPEFAHERRASLSASWRNVPDLTAGDAPSSECAA